ncbi:MAG: cupin domain-containing protein [Elusimicrobiota bacterium]|nr:cupin domain-containing protein [Elusimicrobiota bacterium]
MKTALIKKPWGRELLFARHARYVGKIIVIEKGHRLSLQYHRKKHETVYVLAGRLRLTLGRGTRTLGPGASFAVPPGRTHRFAAVGGRVTLVEVSTPELDDVVRLQDDYGRTGG